MLHKYCIVKAFVLGSEGCRFMPNGGFAVTLFHSFLQSHGYYEDFGTVLDTENESWKLHTVFNETSYLGGL